MHACTCLRPSTASMLALPTSTLARSSSPHIPTLAGRAYKNDPTIWCDCCCCRLLRLACAARLLLLSWALPPHLTSPTPIIFQFYAGALM